MVVGLSALTLSLRPFTISSTASQQREDFPPYFHLPFSIGTAFTGSVMSALSILKLGPAFHGFFTVATLRASVQSLIAVLDGL